MTYAPAPITISEMPADGLAGVRRLCARELVLDRDAAAIPGILMQRPRISLVASLHSGYLLRRRTRVPAAGM